MRSAAAALTGFYRLHLGRDWKLFDLVRSPDPQRLPQVLTRAEVARLFATVREERFLVLLRFMYACGLRISEAVHIEVGDLRGGEGVSIRLISAYLGHDSLETTLIYAHLTAVNEASARAAVARLLPPRR